MRQGIIRIDGIEQGSEEWLYLRLGVLTASQFHRVLTPKTLKPSGQQDDLIAELAAEKVLGYPAVQQPVGWMHHGMAMEPEALRVWSLVTDREVDRPAFVFLDGRRTIGCSPDAVGAEIKCPSPGVQVRRLIAGVLPDEYICQVRGHIYVLGLEECDFISYYPGLPLFRVVVERDDAFEMRLAEELESCSERLVAAVSRMTDMIHHGAM